MEPNANIIAWVALYSFPIVAFAVVRWARSRWSLAQTASVLMVFSVLFLPCRVVIDLPALPPFEKYEVATAAVFLSVLFHHFERVRAARLFRGTDLLFVVLVLSALGTTLTNGDALVYGPTTLPGLNLYDAFQMSVLDVVRVAVPYLVGRITIRRAEDARDLLRVLVVAGLIYSPLLLIELRMSPQFHRWVYGYHAFEGFDMAIRGGGYRPNVFMDHGISCALFMLMTTLASAALWKAHQRVFRLRPWLTTPWLAVMTASCRSLGALVYTAFVPLFALLNPRRLAIVAAVLGGFVLSYPLLVTTDIFPHETLVRVARLHSDERADSLAFRFRHERELSRRAIERPLFGWGGYGRSRIFDPESGRDLSISDGHWIITYGSRGVVGFGGAFLLLLLPALRLPRRLRGEPAMVGALFCGLALVVTVHAVDLIPNGLAHPLPYFYAGGLASIVGRPPTRAAVDESAGRDRHPKVV